ncbi:Organic solvent tolerance protein [Magnetococcus marinus MC-1]|uniref:LPS-assembly protein LptD n=1 Tax=Magnetococcus marinus (strain ATCC BAA-1437 / JCM 17883 / MC-1) TaxID=156889 RepID=A0LA35_MAGMM|nr:LPS assembly protein LptD [Magnetococcus marinus]ABK44828.1 Organic solvent tolerance protein [Magnetococcus marinus MC-1]
MPKRCAPSRESLAPLTQQRVHLLGRGVLSASWLVLAMAASQPLYAATTLIDRADLQRLIAETPIEVEAGFLEHDREHGTITATGGVKILQEGVLDLQAERAMYHMGEQSLNAHGKIQILHDGASYRGEAVILNLGQGSGVIERGQIDMPGPGGIATAERVELLDRNRLNLTKATYTNCDCENPPWFLESDNISVDRAKNTVTAEDVTLRFKGVPIAYLPWLRQPLRKERQSGFLTPSIQYSGANGMEMDIPYYWNIDPARDATLTLHPTSERGVMGKVQYRYLGQGYQGVFEHQGIHDTDLDSYRALTYFDHQQRLNHWKIDAHVETVRSDNFLGDFEQALMDGKSRYISSYLTGERLWQASQLGQMGHMALEGGVRWYENVATDDDYYTVQQAPYLAFTGSQQLPIWDRRIFLTGGVRFDSFYQMKGDATQRLDIAPTLRYSKPLHIGRLSLGAGVRETLYAMRNEPALSNTKESFAHRQASMLSAKLDVELSKNIVTAKNATFKNLRHTIEPTVQYVMNAVNNQDKVPNYDSRVYDTITGSSSDIANRTFTTTNLFEENQYSGVDRISGGHWVSYGVTSRLMGNTVGEDSIREIARVTVGQRYAPNGHEEYQGGHALSDVVLGGSLSLYPSWALEAETRYSPNNKIISLSDTAFTYKTDMGEVEVGYMINRNDTEQDVKRDITYNSKLKLNDEWAWQQELDYSLETSSSKSWKTALVYSHDCWSFELFAGSRLSSSSEVHGGGFAGFIINLSGLGGYGVK